MGTHPIFESDFDCLTDRWVVHEVVRDLAIKSQSAKDDRAPVTKSQRRKSANVVAVALAIVRDAAGHVSGDEVASGKTNPSEKILLFGLKWLQNQGNRPTAKRYWEK